MGLKYFALVMMTKNEEKYALRSFQSVKDEIDTYVIYDTGSTDNTLSELSDWCVSNGKTLHVKKGEFVDFSTSRNVLLDFADEVASEPYQLLLDANDEIRGNWSRWKEIAAEGTASGIMCRQRWRIAHDDSSTTYFNSRIILARAGSRYKGVVHEYVAIEKVENIITATEDIEIYQNRIDDGGKSNNRFQRDYNMLMAEFKRNPDDERTVFYLARTCETLHKFDEALLYFKLRIQKNDSFKEEKFWAFLSIGAISRQRGWIHLAIDAFWRAAELCPRAEAYNALASIYKEESLYRAAYAAVRASCDLEFPSDTILFVQQNDYDYVRWHLMGIIAYYVGETSAGRRGCEMALQHNPDSQLDKDNLAFYL